MIDLKKQKLLIISPHPDDEVLGCGGLIKKVKDAGGKVYILFLTVGVTIDYSQQGISTGQERLDEIEQVAKYMKYDGYRIAFKGDDYHLKLERIPQKDIMHEIENGKKISLNTIKPTIVAIPLPSDYNQDHTATTRAALAATRPADDNTKPLQRIVIGYESVPTAQWSQTSKNPINFYLTLSDTELEAKIAALQLYKSQVRSTPHPRSLRAMKNLSYYRGMFAGQASSEAFYIFRFIM